MLISLIKNNVIYKFILPSTIQGSFWLTDTDASGNKRNLINIEAQNAQWVLKSNYEAQIATNSGYIPNALVKENNFYFIKVNNESSYSIIFTSPVYDKSFKKYSITKKDEIKIGSSNNNDIVFKNGCIDNTHAKLITINDKPAVEDNKSKFGVYVNGKRIKGIKYLEFGDVIYIMGLKVVYMNEYVLVNNYNNTLYMNDRIFKQEQEDLSEEVEVFETGISDEVEKDIVDFYKEEDYFFKSPRFITSIEKKVFNIDAPPQKQKENDMPLLLTMGPMLTMGMSSMVTLTSTLNNAYTNNQPIRTVLPTIIVAGAMLAGMILWPTLTRNYQKRKRKTDERERQEKYKNYLEEKRQEFKTFAEKQKASMFDLSITLEEHQNIIMDKKRRLWERKWDHEDFLSFRIGIGSADLNAEINYPKDGFTMEEDNLRKAVEELGDSVKKIYDVPVNISLVKRKNLVITGEYNLKKEFINNMILQLISEHSFDDVKLVFLIEDLNSDFEFYKTLPHCWDDQKKTRFFANDFEEMNELSFYLEGIFNKRQSPDDNRTIRQEENSIQNSLPYYVIITDDIKKARKLEIVKKVLEEKRNLGFSIIILNNGLANLPNECSNFAFLEEKKSAIIENDLNENNQNHFYMDKSTNINIKACVEKLANIPIKFAAGEGSIPQSVSFLEMYDVGKIEQLNVFDRWQLANASKSLSVPIGLYRENELFKLDLHEKYHGPHGLIAGTTGSGKSEFIITFILSMAVNFSPEEVSFVLIDYKGGGLAYAFENKDLGLKLPHLAGTITNLDSIEIKRSLSSIQSELKRRQGLFNEARTKLGESTMDIYKYQKFYKEGRLTEPVTHLFIISDEFAELKQQEPEFMDQLISTARIGRSLGVHLILATQKPSGVVNDQIWSNSRFKVCLKVQDRSDSMDVIKREDAANLKNPGRFYLQVGYNELFSMGQAAWAGEQYYPTDKIKKRLDKDVAFVDNLGNIIKSISDEKIVKQISLGEESTNVLKYLIQTAKEHNLYAKTLWLPRIPAFIFVDDLKKKYNYNTDNRIIPILGEYDDPNNQRQGLLTIDLTEKGNSLIYGSAGMGKENALITLIYSLISSYTPEQINIYILDFGAEIFKMFSKAPHVGDIIFAEDEEKIKNLFKQLFVEVEKRKELFADYNGDINLYNTNNTNNIMPRIITIINNFEAFNEQKEELSDSLFFLSREGEKYGIIFIMTVTNANGVRTRLQQNFTNLLPLQFNNPDDYYNVIGNTRKMVPAKYKGRGLFKKGLGIYEYQMALPRPEEVLTTFILNYTKKLNDVYKIKAPAIQILPKQVTLEHVKTHMTGLNSIPLGIDRDKLTIVTYDFTKYFSLLVSSLDMESTINFISSLALEFSSLNNVNISVIDAYNNINLSKEKNINYFNDNYQILLTNIINAISTSMQTTSVLFISGYDSFIKKLGNNITLYEKLLQVGFSNKNLKIVVCDSQNKFKNYLYDNNFKNYVDTSSGLWIGNGVADQTLLNITGYNRELRQDVPAFIGFMISRGKVISTMKCIDFTINSKEI